MDSFARILIVAGIVSLAVGLWFSFGPSLPLGNLPGDIRIERPGVRVYLPIMSCVLVGAIATALWWLFSRLR